MKEFFDLMLPHKAIGYDKIRIGQNYDGGYVMINDLADIKIAISGGIGHDDTWEVDASRNHGLKIVAFDENLPCPQSHFAGLPYTVYATKMFGIDLSQNSIIDMLLTGYKDHEAIMKIDIEGAEWNMFQNTQSWNKVRHFVGEFHFDNTLDSFIEKLPVLRKINEKFRVVHIHGNNWSEVIKYGDINIPKVVELTYANVDYYNLVPSDEVFPTELDMPNREDMEDIYLGTFKLP